MFTDKQLVEFGNFLLKTYDVQVHSTDGKNIPLYLRQVTDADFCNWKEEAKPDMLQLPSRHQLGNWVVCDFSFDQNTTQMDALVTSVHFTAGKVKYDLEIHFPDGTATRIYNVDSVFVKPKS